MTLSNSFCFRSPLEASTLNGKPLAEFSRRSSFQFVGTHPKVQPLSSVAFSLSEREKLRCVASGIRRGSRATAAPLRVSFTRLPSSKRIIMTLSGFLWKHLLCRSLRYTTYSWHRRSLDKRKRKRSRAPLDEAIRRVSIRSNVRQS